MSSFSGRKGQGETEKHLLMTAVFEVTLIGKAFLVLYKYNGQYKETVTMEVKFYWRIRQNKIIEKKTSLEDNKRVMLTITTKKIK